MLTGPPITLAEADFAGPIQKAVDHVAPYKLFEVGPLAVTNHLVMTVVSAVLVLLVFIFVASRVRVRNDHAEEYTTDGKLAQMFEVMCIFIREEVARPNLGKLTDKYIYYVWTVFFFILFANVLGMVPLAYFTQLVAWAVGAEHPEAYSHWSGTATSNLSLNIPLALCSLIAIVFIGIREGGRHFFAHFAPVPFKPIAMLPIALMLVFLEVLGVLIRSGVLAMRLFGTMLAGHLVIAVLIALIFIFAMMWVPLGYGAGIGVVLLALALSLLELFIAMLQAFIFTFLTVLFIAGGAVHDGEEHGPHEEPGGDQVHELEEEGFVDFAEKM